MSNLTVIGICSCCGKKFKEHEMIYKNPIGIPGRREKLCAFCYNYKKPRIFNTLICFICLFVLIGLVEVIYSFFFSKNEILDTIISCAYLILFPLFIGFEIFISKKKIVTK